MDWKIFHFNNNTEITVNTRVITHFNRYGGEGDQVPGTEIHFMSGALIVVKEKYDEVISILKGQENE